MVSVMHDTSSHAQNQKLVILGQVSSASFPPWIERQARLLGLGADMVIVGADRIEVAVHGQPELIEALAVGCLLGPIDVWVDSIERTDNAPAF